MPGINLALLARTGSVADINILFLRCLMSSWSSPDRTDAEQELAAGERQPEIKAFELVAAGDLGGLKNALCIYEIAHGRVFDLKLANRHGLFLIHSAAYYGHKEMVDFLLSSINEVDETDQNLYQALAEDAFSLDSTETEGTSAADATSVAAPVYAHAKSANRFVNVRSLDQGATPLHFAAMGGNRSSIALYLLACGADPMLRDNSGNTAQELARAHGHRKTEKKIRKYVEEINTQLAKASQQAANSKPQESRDRGD